MHGFGQNGFDLAIRVQRGWFRLAERPKNAGQRHKEQRDAYGFVQRKQPGLVGQLIRRVIRQVIGDDPERDHNQNAKCGQPVKGLGHCPRIGTWYWWRA